VHVEEASGSECKNDSDTEVAVEGTILRPCLEYCDNGTERHLTLALIKCWVPR